MKKLGLKILITVFIFAIFCCSFSFVSAETTATQVQGNYYSLTLGTNNPNQKVRLNGIHSSLLPNFEYNFNQAFTNQGYMVSPYFIDAEKIDGASRLCWAASAANMLQYTGWANEVDKSIIDFDTKYDNFSYDINEEDGIFNYFAENFTNSASNNIYAFSWFFSGKYDAPGTPDQVAQPTQGSGGLLPNVYYTYLANYFETNNVQALNYLTKYLDMGAAVCMMMNWRDVDELGYPKNGNHVLTIWGYVYDVTKADTDEDYCLSLLYTDSDDDEYEDYSFPADDKLRKMDIRICKSHDVSNNPRLTEDDIGKIISENYSGKNITMVASSILTLAPQCVLKDDFSTTVTTNEDVSNISDGKISLREAISYAKHTNTTVTFDSSLSGATFELKSPISIKNALKIDASSLSVKPTVNIQSKSGDEHGAFQLYSTANVEITNLDFTSSLPSSVHLSAIYNQGVLKIQNCKIYGFLSDAGGGIYNNGKLTIIDSEITGNSATQAGGGIYCATDSQTTIEGTTKITGNTASNQTCNLYINEQYLNVNGLTDNANIGLYLTLLKDKDDNEVFEKVLCSVNPTVADTVFNVLKVDNNKNYSISLSKEKDEIIISKTKTIAPSGCGTITTLTPTSFLPFLIPILCFVFFTVARKRKQSN